MYGRLNNKQKNILCKYDSVYSWDNLEIDIQNVIEKLSTVKNDENTWSDAERYLADNYVYVAGRIV